MLLQRNQTNSKDGPPTHPGVLTIGQIVVLMALKLRVVPTKEAIRGSQNIQGWAKQIILLPTDPVLITLSMLEFSHWYHPLQNMKLTTVNFEKPKLPIPERVVNSQHLELLLERQRFCILIIFLRTEIHSISEGSHMCPGK